MTYPIIIVFFILTFIHIMKTQRQGIQISVHISDSRHAFRLPASGYRLLRGIIGIPDLGLYISLGFFSIIATLQVLLGKASRNANRMPGFRSGVSGLIMGTSFLYLHTRTTTDQLIAGRTGISDLTLYVATGCHALAFLSFSANLNKLLKKQGTHFRNGVLGALFGTVFLFLDYGKRWPLLLANITGQNNLLQYASLASYGISVFSILMEGNKRLKVASGNTKRAILCAGFGGIIKIYPSPDNTG